jgi:hypothetical protein
MLGALEWLADDAVQSEPVSAPFSLLTGKNTGKFTRTDQLQYPYCQNEPENPGTFDGIPCAPEQGIFGEKTGNGILGTGKIKPHDPT